MNQKVCENHLYVKNPSLTLANRQSYRLAQGLSKLAPNAASETRRETMVKSEEANNTTVVSRREKAAAFSERQRRVLYAHMILRYIIRSSGDSFSPKKIMLSVCSLGFPRSHTATIIIFVPFRFASCLS